MSGVRTAPASTTTTAAVAPPPVVSGDPKAALLAAIPKAPTHYSPRRNPDAALAGKLGEVLKSMGTTLEGDPRIRAAINQFARRAIAGMAASYGGQIVKLVSETVRGCTRRVPTKTDWKL